MHPTYVKVLFVPIPFGVEDVHLEGRLGVFVKGGSCPDVGHGRMPMAVRGLAPHRVNAPSGQQFQRIADAEVGGRETEFATDGVAVNDATRSWVGRTKPPIRFRNVALTQGLSDFGRAHPHVFDTVGVERLNVESQGLAERLECRKISRSMTPKPMVIPNDDGHRLDEVAHQRFGVFPRRHGGQFLGEWMQNHVVESGARKQFKSLVKGIQKFQSVVFGVEHRAGVRVEAEQGGCGAMTGRNLPQLLQHSAMSRVHAIKRSYGQNRTLAVRRVSREFGCVVMHSHYAKLGAEF